MKPFRTAVFALACLIAPLAYTQVEIQGHRGTRGLKPENTLPAFMAAIEAGADVLELDLLTTKDGILVIHHNFFLNPSICVSLDGTPLLEAPLVSKVALLEIKKIDCGSKTNPDFPQQEAVPGTQIPTLAELFTLIKSSSHPHAKTVRLNLEVKRDPFYPDRTISAADLAKKVVEEVKKSGLADRVYYSSFDPSVLAEIRKLDSSCGLGFIFGEESMIVAEQLSPENPLDAIIQIASALGIQTLSPDHVLLLSKELVGKLKTAGFRVIPWTVNDLKRCEELIKMGVDGLITDYPLAVIQHLKK